MILQLLEKANAATRKNFETDKNYSPNWMVKNTLSI